MDKVNEILEKGALDEQDIKFLFDNIHLSPESIKARLGLAPTPIVKVEELVLVPEEVLKHGLSGEFEVVAAPVIAPKKKRISKK